VEIGALTGVREWVQIMKDEANRSGNKFCMVVLLARPTRALEGHELGVAPTRSKEGTPGAGLQERTPISEYSSRALTAPTSTSSPSPGRETFVERHGRDLAPFLGQSEPESRRAKLEDQHKSA
jgi:hypothetical protein